ncbi:metallophosphoesterase family protein [Leptospira idonii]|uniref:Phosphohydrolase n=1 Tax=Leptospira idonii TaxID=1193500 RepID=A0A4R9LYJ3_9LEPT|nr:metallophosphoesterase [Leptospira idonii]TGN17661.1 phosphohydrolase [Leptospira idonii]
MKIIHISDLHFPTHLPLFSLRGKSVIGYLNYSLRRRKKYPMKLVETLISTIQDLEYDALVISGDITNVSHESEFIRAKKILSPVLNEKAFLIPGNHDRYKKESLKPESLFEKHFGDYLGESLSSSYYLRRKEIAGQSFIGWDSNQPLPIAKANGYVPLEVIGETFEKQKKDYVLVCHHPLWNPKGQEESSGHKMSNRADVAKSLNSQPPSLYLHGHTHTNWIKKPGNLMPFYIVNSASSTRLSDSGHECGFHLIEKDNNGQYSFKRYIYLKNKNEFKESPLVFLDEENGVV